MNYSDVTAFTAFFFSFFQVIKTKMMHKTAYTAQVKYIQNQQKDYVM